MKKFYFLSVFAVLALMDLRVNAQVNILPGSNMEHADSVLWDTTRMINDPADVNTFEFGYTAATPTQGTGGCLHVSGTNTAGNNTIAFFQEVTIKKGKMYAFDMAVKSIAPIQKYWFECYSGTVKPKTGSDYSIGGDSIVFKGGFKYSGWVSNCSDDIDGTLLANGCAGGRHDSILYTGTGDTTIYLVIKIGANDGGNFDFLIDNVTLKDLDSTASAISTVNALTINVFPNPAGDAVNIDGASQYTQADIMNVLGQKIFTAKNFGKTIDVSGLKPGVYFIRLRDAQNNIAISKFQKR